MPPVVALLPMKGHSERVPAKNLRDFAGNPLFHAVARTLEACPLVSDIVIDTDSDAIKADALAHFRKVRVIDRPAAICGDFVSMNTIIDYDLSQLPDRQHFLQTHATNPLLTKDTIEKAIVAYFEALRDGYDSLFSVTRWQTRLYWEDGRAINHNPAELLRTQDLPPVFEENSNFYLFSRESFLAAGQQRIGKQPRMFPVNRLEAFDIDEPEDFLLAELSYRLRNAHTQPAS